MILVSEAKVSIIPSIPKFYPSRCPGKSRHHKLVKIKSKISNFQPCIDKLH